MLLFRNRFGDHHRQIGDAAHRRGVHVVEHEAELFPEDRPLKLRFGVGEVQFHLVVDLYLVLFVGVRVVAGTAGVDIVQQLAGFLVVGLHMRFSQTVVGQMQGEVDRGELPWTNRFGDGVVAQQLGGETRIGEIAVLEAVPAFEVCGDADSSAFKEDGDERDALPRFVGHAAANFGGLGRCQRSCQRGRQKQRRQQREAFEQCRGLHRASSLVALSRKMPKTAEPEPDMAAYTAPLR